MPFQMQGGVQYPTHQTELEIQALLYSRLVADGWDAHMEVPCPGGRLDIVIFEDEHPWLGFEVKRYSPSEGNKVWTKAEWYADVLGCRCVVVSSVDQGMSALDQHIAMGH